jgi:hypothetical protein
MSARGAERPHPMRSLAILAAAALSFALAQTPIVPAIGELIDVSTPTRRASPGC